MELIALNFLPLPSYMSRSIQILLLYGPHLSEMKLHVITHVLAYFAIMRTANSLKTDNYPVCISKHFKQFLHSFSIKKITDTSYTPQTQDTVKQTHYTLKLQIKN